MAVIRLGGFAGENRALHPTLLADAVGVVSRNHKPGRGDLRPWRLPLTVATVPAGRKTIYRMGRDTATDLTYWLSWAGTVHAVRGFDPDDTTERTYYTGDGVPKVTDNLALDGTGMQDNPGVNWRPLGLPAPATAPSVAAVAAAVDADEGKFEFVIDDTLLKTLPVGEVLRFTRVIDGEDQTPQAITLTAASGGSVVTRASLAAQIDALTDFDALAQDGADGVVAGVRVRTTTVAVGFFVEKKVDTAEDYDPDVVTYTNLFGGQATGANAVDNPGETPDVPAAPAVITIASTSINATDTPVNDVWTVTVNGAQPVLVTVPSGAGTFPSAVTATSLASVLGVAGVKATVVKAANGVSDNVRVETTAVGAAATLLIRRVTPGTKDVFSRLGGAAEISAADATKTTVFYVYTFVNDWGWESAPSPPSAELSRAGEATATISGFADPPAGNYSINKLRIYRTQTGASGATDFFFLREVALGTASTTDDNRDLGEALPTNGWTPPPDDLTHLTALWGGMLAGISGNRVRFCEPFSAYAWPDEYDAIPPDAKPVALGVVGQQLLVLTTGRPLVLSGSGPDSMAPMPMDLPQGCVSARSVVSMGAGVAWASEDGLCWYGAGGARVLTNGVMRRDDWQALVPSSIVGKLYEGLYFGSYDDGSGRRGFMIDPGNPQGIYFLDTGYEGMHFDEFSDQLYVLSGASVTKWDAGTAPMVCRFRSKVFRAPMPMNFACAEVNADAFPVTLRIWADGALRHTQVVRSGGAFWLPAGFLASQWQFEIEGTTAVQSVAVATSIAELAQV